MFLAFSNNICFFKIQVKRLQQRSRHLARELNNQYKRLFIKEESSLFFAIIQYDHIYQVYTKNKRLKAIEPAKKR